MILFKKIIDLHKWLEIQRKNESVIGFVPTMGALHEGHSSLIKAAKKNHDLVVCSIFVNPAQFNDPADFEKYPVTIDKDIERLTMDGCDALFLPSVSEIYPGDGNQVKHYELGRQETLLEGKFRPGHFQGVCRVVERLLHIIHPRNLYLGQKDYQQCIVISRLVEIMGMAHEIHIQICPTLREKDGLAMSSRNRRLDEQQRIQSPAIYKTLLYIKEHIRAGFIQPIISESEKKLAEKGFRVEYVTVADAKTLVPVFNWDGYQKIVALLAASLGDVRLIDNLLLN